MTDIVQETGRPRPTLTPESAPFWEGAQQQRLLIQHCSACRKINWLPRAFCAYCASEDMVWEQASGRATLESYSVIYRPINPSWKDQVPYVLVTVRLEEGIRMVSRLIIDEGRTPKIDGPLRVVFAPLEGDFLAPFWEEVEAE